MQNKLILALDNLSISETKKIVSELKWENIIFKVNDLYSLVWLNWLSEIFDEQKIMLDAKWYDIPNTMKNYLRQLNNSKIWKNTEFLTVHASSGKKALEEIMKEKKQLQLKTKILAVTILTSFDDLESSRIYDEKAKNWVLKLASIALEAWVDWIVCSPLEAPILREIFWENFLIVSPWVRFENSKKDDQTRTLTPKKAIESGVNHIVMWRPILNSENPVGEIERFFVEIKSPLSQPFPPREKGVEQNNIPSPLGGGLGRGFLFEKYLFSWNYLELLKYIWAFYFRTENWKYCRLASGLLSNAYINIWAIERNFLVVEKVCEDLSRQIVDKKIEADIVMWAQMWSVRISLYLAEKLGIETSIYTEKSGNDNEKMQLKRHKICLEWKKIILSEDIIARGSTIKKMIELIKKDWGEVVGITCVWNRFGKDNFEWIPLFSCFVPPKFELYFDEKTSEENKWNFKKFPEKSEISEKPKNDWDFLIKSMK